MASTPDAGPVAASAREGAVTSPRRVGRALAGCRGVPVRTGADALPVPAVVVPGVVAARGQSTSVTVVGPSL